MDENLRKQLRVIASTIRQLSMEAVQKANSGHPGLPMGCAEFGAYLYGKLLRHNPKNPKWLNRDRFILSAGHGSMLLYACLALSGFGLTIDDIKQFRQDHSKTPGHPEYGMTDGVEATTGPLGQGISNAVGQALGLKLLARKFNGEKYHLFTSKVYCLAGDGCMMEGVASEASCLAGHLSLDNLVLIHDANHVCLDGPLSETFSEDTKARYRAYGWDVFELDGYDFDAMDTLFSEIQRSQKRPCFIEMRTIIGKGSPHKAGTHEAHGAPLGVEELAEAKKALGLPEEEFFVPQSVETYFANKLEKECAQEKSWKEMVRSWAEENPTLYNQFMAMIEKRLPEDLEKKLDTIEMKTTLAGRAASQIVLHTLGECLPQLQGGSADLSCSDLTMMKEFSIVAPGDFSGRNIKYGVREFAMAGIATGLAQTDMITPFVGTFLIFSDYMRNATRIAALSKVQVIYQFTHDSVFLGEDGPTHQPIEQLTALRAIPNLHVIRPADNWEVKKAWIAALRYRRGPTAIILSRQALPELAETRIPYAEGMARGGYILKKESSEVQFTLIATGSEVSLALDVAAALEKRGRGTRVVSMPCVELFEKQTPEYQESVLGGESGRRVSIEAGATVGWYKWIGRDGIAIGIDTFGMSAPLSEIKEEFGFTVDSILARLLK